MHEATLIKNHLKNRKKQTLITTIAAKLGVSVAYVSMLLSGKRTNPEMLKKIKELVNQPSN